MHLIDQSKLTVGQRVYYTYSKLEQRMGPFKVEGFWNDYRGRHVRLVPTDTVAHTTDTPRNVHLSDDEDFGALLFYAETQE